jgi:MerR family transcriptional regulator/heat shock protein HspR
MSSTLLSSDFEEHSGVSRRERRVAEPAADRAVYGISVASELTGVQPQALRDYESRGLIEPFRTEGGTRRYSRDDLDRIAHISSLLSSGLNLEGVGQVLLLQAETKRLHDEIKRLKKRPQRS